MMRRPSSLGAWVATAMVLAGCRRREAPSVEAVRMIRTP